MHRRGCSAVAVLKNFTERFIENHQRAPVQRLAIRGTRARRLAVSSLTEPNKALVSVKNIRQIYKHYINRRARRNRNVVTIASSSPDFILIIQTFLFSIRARYPMTTTVRP